MSTKVQCNWGSAEPAAQFTADVMPVPGASGYPMQKDNGPAATIELQIVQRKRVILEKPVDDGGGLDHGLGHRKALPPFTAMFCPVMKSEP